MTPTYPCVSVVTTVYDRVACLDRCLRAMRHVRNTNFEQIVVSDCPAPEVQDQIRNVVASADPRMRVQHYNLPERHNDWGMTPAWVGVKQALGDYVCFLSDDNAYLPDHFPPLVALLDQHPGLGFVYSSCLYDGRCELRTAPPMGARIDLGQPLFRRQVLLDCFPRGFPWHEFAWDWRLIHALMERGVTWKHHDALSFVFRLASYPALMESLA
jgi:glycosyltransferase involved in cell wall biosynthesis